MMCSICEKCAMDVRCPIDSSSNVQRCGFFIEKQDPEKIMNAYADHFADMVAVKVIERIKTENLALLEKTIIGNDLAKELAKLLKAINEGGDETCLPG